MNPRYLAYCKAHGKSPEEMLQHDTEAWPGGKMCGFILWHSERLREFSAQYGCCSLGEVSLKLMGGGHGPQRPPHDVHAIYEDWLEKRVATLRAAAS